VYSGIEPLSVCLFPFFYFIRRLARMNWKWEEFSVDTQKAMLERCIVSFQEGTVVGLSSLLNSFQVMGYRWKENGSVRQVIFAGIISHFGNGKANASSGRRIANIIYYLGQSKIEWDDIPTDVQNSFFNGISHCHISFNEQHISNTIHG
jgi:hypothetical protein